MFFIRFSKLFLLFVLNDLAIMDSIFEDTAKLCESKCSCNSHDGTFLFSCKGIHRTLANWPDLTKNETSIEATFSENSITRLEPMPGTNVSLSVFYDHCNITDLPNGLFESVVNVKFVDLSYNLIEGSGLHSAVFRGPYNKPIRLEHLNLAYNRIGSLEMNLFKHTPELRWLSLEGNPFRVIQFHTVASVGMLTKLEYFNIANTKIMHLPTNFLTPLTSLNVLDLSENEITFVPLTVLDVGKTLKKLIVDKSNILEFNNNTFLGMTELTELSAKNLKELKYIRTNAFAPMKNLEKVDLSGMNGSVIVIEGAAFGDGVPKLKELNLSHSNLKWLPVNLVNWSQLNSLDLRKNQFYCECYLVNITDRLPDEIKRERDGPRCYDLNRQRMYEIYNLTRDVCFNTKEYSDFGPHKSNSSRVVKIILMVLTIMLLASGVALWLWRKRRNTRRNTQYFSPPFRYLKSRIISKDLPQIAKQHTSNAKNLP